MCSSIKKILTLTFKKGKNKPSTEIWAPKLVYGHVIHPSYKYTFKGKNRESMSSEPKNGISANTMIVIGNMYAI
jgi:hypothetical protein